MTITARHDPGAYTIANSLRQWTPDEAERNVVLPRGESMVDATEALL